MAMFLIFRKGRGVFSWICIKECYDKGKEKRGILMRQKLKWMMLPFGFALLGGFFVLFGSWGIAIALWMFAPFSWMMVLGNPQKRMLNLLPVLMASMYVGLGLEFGLWQEGLLLFQAIPFLGILIRPKRTFAGYAALSISILSILIEYAFHIQISWWVKTMLIAIIYWIYLPPAIIEKLLPKKDYPYLFELIAPIYGWFYEGQKKRFRKSLDLAKELLSCDQGKKVLDIGCGTGALASVAQERGLQVTAVDPTRGMLKVAKRKDKSKQIQFLQGNALHKLPFEDHTFDVVCASYVAHGLKKEERQLLYHEMKRLAKEKIVLLEYNQHRTLLSDIVEYAEGGDYFSFIQVVKKELSHFFGNVTQKNVAKTSAVYVCTVQPSKQNAPKF